MQRPSPRPLASDAAVVALAALIAAGGCSALDLGLVEEDTEDAGTTATYDPSTGTVSYAEDSTGPTDFEDPSCEEEQLIPAAPVDCSEAAGEIEGDVMLSEGDDPSIFEGITRVTGSVQISGTSLTNLDFMACVERIEGDLSIVANDELANLDGLWSLTESGSLRIQDNPAIIDMDGLPNLLQLTSRLGSGDLVIQQNSGMTGISGFHSFVGLDNDLTIQGNNVLTHIDGLGGTSDVGGILTISDNPMLCMSSINCVGDLISIPATPPDSWTIEANDMGC